MTPGMTCDILASDRGPSCTKMSHLPNLKLIHVRFIKDDSQSITKPFKSTFTSSKLVSWNFHVGTCNKPSSSVLKRFSVLSSVQQRKNSLKSLPVSKMMQCGKVITNMRKMFEDVQYSNFDINGMAWSLPVTKKFRIEDESFADGGFREAFMARLVPDDGKIYVVKKYKQETIKSFEEVRETAESHARKSV